MSRLTPNFGFLVIEPGDDPFQNGHQFFAADRDQLDRLIHALGSGHVHDGEAGAGSLDPVDAPDLSLDSTGGSIGAGARIWYTYTLVSQTNGSETVAAPAAFIDTPAVIAPPAAPAVAWGSTGGTLQPGQYLYKLSAWVDASTNETSAINAGGVQIPVGTVTNRTILELPDLPAGAQGFNIYRRKPGGANYDFLATVDLDVATPPTDFVDDGILEDCDRLAPTKNTTNSTNAITVGFPDVALPAGHTWKIYRTVTDSDWSASLLHHVTEESVPGTIDVEFIDQGFGTSTGQPPTVSVSSDSPEKIVLTGAAHVAGFLPSGRVAAYQHQQPFAFPGIIETGMGESLWPIPFDEVEIIGAIATLGDGSAPAAGDVIYDVLVGTGATPTYASIFDDPGDRGTIPVGDTVGGFAPATVAEADRRRVRGDVVGVSIDQTGGGATPTDEDLVVTVLMWARITTDPDTTKTWD